MRHNERNPYRQLLTGKAEDSGETASVSCEEGGDDVNQHGPYIRGDTRVTMGGTEGATGDEGANPKPHLSSDRVCNLTP